MIVSQKQINEFKKKLRYGKNKPLAYRLGIKQSALSRHLSLQKVHDPITDTDVLGYQMPQEIFDGIKEYIKTL